MGIHRGTHGTTMHRADLIEKEGFGVTAVGRAGSGVYLWAYIEDSTVAHELAVGWYESQRKAGKYSDESQPKWAVLHAEIDVDDADCLDCNNPRFREALVAWLRKLGRSPTEGYSEKDLSQAYNALIKRVEVQRARPFSIIQTCVPLPNKMAYKEKIVGADPFVCLVKRDEDRLKVINRINEVDDMPEPVVMTDDGTLD